MRRRKCPGSSRSVCVIDQPISCLVVLPIMVAVIVVVMIAMVVPVSAVVTAPTVVAVAIINAALASSIPDRCADCILRAIVTARPMAVAAAMAAVVMSDPGRSAGQPVVRTTAGAGRVGARLSVGIAGRCDESGFLA